jgi:hypothetical protein
VLSDLYSRRRSICRSAQTDYFSKTAMDLGPRSYPKYALVLPALLRCVPTFPAASGPYISTHSELFLWQVGMELITIRGSGIFYKAGKWGDSCTRDVAISGALSRVRP